MWCCQKIAGVLRLEYLKSNPKALTCPAGFLFIVVSDLQLGSLKGVPDTGSWDIQYFVRPAECRVLTSFRQAPAIWIESLNVRTGRVLQLPKHYAIDAAISTHCPASMTDEPKVVLGGIIS